jgi:hypothetical protein
LEPELGERPTSDLLRLYGQILTELRTREIIRSENSPVGDYAEYLVARAFGFRLVANSSIGYDAIGDDGVRYQVKGRRITPWNRSRQLGAIRGLSGATDPFDALVAVLFDPDMAVTKAVMMPIAAVKAVAREQPHVNGWRLVLTDAVLQRADIRDVTSEVRAAEDQDRDSAMDVPLDESPAR